MAGNRPLSPHLGIWKWRPAALVSIFHRISGHALAIAGIIAFTWWLVAATIGPEAYDTFLAVAGSPFGWLVWVGLSWAVFQHLLSGLRHLFMDAGWGYQLGIAHGSATGVFVLAVILTAAFWALVLLGVR